MSRANPFEFIAAMNRLGVQLETDDKDSSLRPKKLFRRLERAGFSIEHSKPQTQVLLGFGFKPATVFDIGVDQGTPLIYNAFPDAKFVLVDPVRESEQRVSGWRGKIDYEFHCCAVGAHRGDVEINIPSTDTKQRISRASAYKFEPGNAEQFARFDSRIVPMNTLDSLSWRESEPFGLKIDTEGFELEVVKGAKKTLKKTEFVIAEVSAKRRFQGSYRFSELIAALGRQGFEPLDFLSPLRPEKEGCDILFARYDSPRFNFGGR